MRVLLAHLLLLAAIAPGTSRATSDEVESPHAAAVRLVIENCGDEIKELDQGPAWWHDTKERTWSAKRPFGPGTIDSTHYFQVSYAIDGQVLRTWSVNTRTGQIAGPGGSIQVE